MVRARRVLDEETWECIVRDIESIVSTYRKMNKVMSLRLDDRVRMSALRELCSWLESERNIDKQAVIIDLGAGPGDSLSVIMKTCSNLPYIVALDPSPRLLRYVESSAFCDKVVAVAEHIPLRNRAVSGVTAFYAARDFKDLDAAIMEMNRVLGAGGIAIGDIFLPKNILARILVKAWICYIVPVLALIVARNGWKHYLGLCKSIRGWLSVEELCEKISQHNGERISKAIYKKYVLGGLGYVVAKLQ